jgi:hypothetical protein
MEIKMDKVKLEFKIPEAETIEYNGVSIQVIPYLSFAEQVLLINHYLEDYFNDSLDSLIPVSEYNYIEAEFGLKNYVFQTITNIDTTNLNNDIYKDAGLWDAIVSKIANYGDFMDKLNSIVDEIKEQKMLNNQLGKVLSGLLDKLNNIFENITPEEIEKLQEETGKLADKLKEVSPLADSLPASPVAKVTLPQ